MMYVVEKFLAKLLTFLGLGFVIGAGVLGTLFAFFFIFISFIINAWLWPETINTWLVYLGKEAVITWWMGMLITFVPFLGRPYVAIIFTLITVVAL